MRRREPRGGSRSSRVPPWQRRCGVSRPTPRRGISSQRGACLQPAGLFGSRRIGIPVAFAKAVATKQEDLGVLHQPVGDGGRDGGVVEDVAPVGEGRVGGNDGGSLVTVARGDDLVKEIGALLIER